jgi:hypothetical protein
MQACMRINMEGLQERQDAENRDAEAQGLPSRCLVNSLSLAHAGEKNFCHSGTQAPPPD